MRAAVALAMLVTAVLAGGCTFELSDPGVTVACTALELEINRGDAGDEQVAAVLSAAERYGAVTGRDVVYLGETDESASDGDRNPEGPVLVEFHWPGDAPQSYGFAEPVIVDSHYVGGYVYLHPMVADAPADMVTRLTMHELGHLSGLADVDDWGSGDFWGLHLTHAGC